MWGAELGKHLNSALCRTVEYLPVWSEPIWDKYCGAGVQCAQYVFLHVQVSFSLCRDLSGLMWKRKSTVTGRGIPTRKCLGFLSIWTFAKKKNKIGALFNEYYFVYMCIVYVLLYVWRGYRVSKFQKFFKWIKLLRNSKNIPCTMVHFHFDTDLLIYRFLELLFKNNKFQLIPLSRNRYLYCPLWLMRASNLCLIFRDRTTIFHTKTKLTQINEMQDKWCEKKETK